MKRNALIFGTVLVAALAAAVYFLVDFEAAENTGNDPLVSAADEAADAAREAAADLEDYCNSVPQPTEPALIYFVSNSSDALTVPSQEITLQYIDYLKCHQESATADIIGYTADVGDPAGELALSQERADVVYQFAIDQGVNHLQLHTEARGAADPIADNTTESGRAQNRRVVLEIKAP